MTSQSLSTVLSTLKACVISSPDGVEEERLNSDFRQLMGCNIPWRELGFKNLQDLIKSSPSVRLINKGGRRFVVAETDSVEHLSSMIKSQKKSIPRRRHPKRNRFSRLSNTGGGSGRFQHSNYFEKSTYYRNIDYFEHNNNNTNVKLPASKEINHHNNARPAGDESSSGSASPLFDANTSSKQPLQKEKSKKEKTKEKNKFVPEDPKKNKPKPLLPNLKDCKLINKINHQETKSTVKPPGKSSPSPTTESPTFIPSLVSNLPKRPLLPDPLLSPNSYSHQQMITRSHDRTAAEPIVYFSPINLQNAFIPANLVPPKPMKPGWYLGTKQKVWARNKLMSIKDNSSPSECSLTAKFKNLIKTQEWPEPEYRLLPRIGPNKMEVYGCTVRGSYSLNNNEIFLTYDYSTIPDEFSDKNASKEAVSLKAFEDMSNKIKEASDYVPVTSNIDEIINRVYKIVTDFPYGLWAYKVESDYRVKFNERLPSKWIDIVSQSNILVAEKLAEFSYVVRPIKKTNGEIEAACEMSLGELEYPETETWDVYVTKIVSSSEVWFRFVGPNYSDWLDEMIKEMCDHYQDWSMFVCPSPVVGEVYVYPTNYGAVRVQVLSLDVPNMATVMHIDHGDVEEVCRDHLCVLDINFKKLPPQAVKCKMNNLDQYSEDKLCTAYLMDKVEGIVLVAEIVQTEPLALIMYDTSSDEPINMNQHILNALKIDVTIPPSFSKDLKIQEGLVTSLWKTGEIYLQLPNDGMTHLSYHLNSLTDFSPDQYLAHPEEVLSDILYLVKDAGSWLRATVLPPGRPIGNVVELLLVDTGDIRTSLFTELIPLYLISMVLCEIPRQALRVRLAGANMSEEAVKKLQNLISPPCNVIIEVVNIADVPEVKLFIWEQKGLISINHTLLVEENITSNLKSVSLNNPGTRFASIEQATTPDCNNYFDVYVVSVSNPSNFTVIPRKYLMELTELQNKLQDYYEAADPVYNKLKSLTTGQACAVQHSDGLWYRGLIEQIVDPSNTQLLIKFCDFGNFAMVSAERLYSLDEQFLNLPALGFNASIADIQPISHDWEFNDCILTQKLMLEKNLVTLIKSKEENEGQVFLKLQVFDTSDKDTDCDIGKILVEEARAKYSDC